MQNIATNLSKEFRKFQRPIIVGMIIVLLGLGYKYFVQSSDNGPPPGAKVVEVEKVELKSIKEKADFIGTIKSEQQTTLSAKTQGILNIIAKSGQKVKKGELIAQIINKDVDHNYKLLKDAEVIARTQFERMERLLKYGVISKHAMEEKKAALLEAQKRLSDSKIISDEMKLYAPFDGVVGLFKFREGSQVYSGDAVVNFYDPVSTLVEFEVPLAVAMEVADGGQVLVNNKEYKLTHIQKMLDEATHMCPAYVHIDCSGCIIGSAVEISLIVREHKDVVVIPFEAVFLQEGKQFVYVVKDGKAVLTAVELGIRDKRFVEITSGVAVGDQVVTFGHNRLYPFIPVTIASDKKIS